jgi:membrane associated rhomboid family serine protease
MAAWIVIGRRLDRDVTQIIFLLGINVVLGFVIGGIDWRAHLGGAVTGAVVGLILTTGRGQEGRRQVGQQAGAALAVLLGLVVLVMVRTTQIQELVPALLG